MAIQHLRSTTAGNTPDSLLPGELAVNLSDSKLFIGDGSSVRTDSDGSEVSPAPPSGEGWRAFNLSHVWTTDSFTTSTTSQQTYKAYPLADVAGGILYINGRNTTTDKSQTYTVNFQSNSASVNSSISNVLVPSNGGDCFTVSVAVSGSNVVVYVTADAASTTEYTVNSMIFTR